MTMAKQVTKISELSPTSFQNDPNKEVQTIDPYKVEELNEVSSLSPFNDTSLGTLDGALDLLPAELSGSIINDFRVTSRSSSLGLNLSQYISKVSNLLPPGENLTGMLRSLNLVDIEQNLPRLISQVGIAGITGKSDKFLTNVLTYMVGSEDLFNVEKYADQINADTLANSLGLDEVISSSLALGLVSDILNGKPLKDVSTRTSSLNYTGSNSIISLIQSMGYGDVKLLSGLGVNLDLVTLSTLVTSITQYDKLERETTTNLVRDLPINETSNVLESMNRIGYVNSNDITTTINTVNVNNYIDLSVYIDEAGTYGISRLLDAILVSTLATVTDTFIELGSLDIDETVIFMADVLAAGGTAAWVVANPTINTYDNLIIIINANTLTEITEIVTIAELLRENQVLQILAIIGKITEIESTKVLDQAIINGSKELIIISKDIKVIGIENINSLITNAVNDAGIKRIFDITNASLLIGIDNLINLNSLVDRHTTIIITDALTSLKVLSITELNEILDIAKSVDIYTVINDSEMSDRVKDITLFKALLLSANSGKQQTTLELIRNANLSLDKNLLNKLIKDLLDNYKHDPTSMVIGPYLAATSFINSLNEISADWLMIERNAIEVNNQGIFRNATIDVLNLIKYDSRVSFSAELQLSIFSKNPKCV